MKWFNYLPVHWQENVREYLRSSGSKYDGFSSADFTSDLRLKFEDGSYAFFSYALFIADDNNFEIAVFTEHCGYHIFPFCISRLETINKEGEVVRSETFLTE